MRVDVKCIHESKQLFNFYFCCFPIIFYMLSSCLSKSILVSLTEWTPITYILILTTGCSMLNVYTKTQISHVLKERKLYKLFTSWHTHYYIIDRLQLRQIQHIINVNFCLCFKQQTFVCRLNIVFIFSLEWDMYL